MKQKSMFSNRTIVTFILLSSLTISSCYKEDNINVKQQASPTSDDELDQYIYENFQEEFGIAIRYKFVDRYVDPTKRVAPPRRGVVKPMLDFLSDYWIEPFLSVENGSTFFRKHVPAEVVLVGSSIFNDDGTVTLGTADAGARITLTEVNDINTADREWIFRQLGTIYHEFAHIIHQRYNLPSNWEKISPSGYTSSGSWYNISEEEALRRGFVSPYATSSFNEDFAELGAFVLFDPEFYQTYYNYETTNCTTADCQARNQGRERIRTKLTALLNHYEQYTGVDLLKVRAIIQKKLPQ